MHKIHAANDTRNLTSWRLPSSVSCMKLTSSAYVIRSGKDMADLA